MERDCDSRNELIEGLKKAAQGNSRNKTARLREIFDEVEAAKESGLSLKAIVAVLAERGLVFDLATFVNTRHRIKKELVKDRAISALPNPSLPETAKPPAIDHLATRDVVKDVALTPGSLAQTAPASMKLKTLVAQETQKEGVKTLSPEEIKNLSKQEIDLSDYQ